MRVLVVSDVHANLTALDAVLADAVDYDAVWCLGDLVGYGPDPNECIARLREQPGLICLLGNHDAAALGSIEVDAFNYEARVSVQYMQSVLTEASLKFLKSLPEKVVVDDVTLAHGSPRNPVWEYILDPRVARYNFDHFDTPFCFVGHTHLPIIYFMPDEDSRLRLLLPEANDPFTLEPRALANPGSLGQPRDRDPRAAYALFDSDKREWLYRRVAYDVPSVQRRIVAAGLPERHAVRLAEGW